MVHLLAHLLGTDCVHDDVKCMVLVMMKVCVVV
jgi:hypothetical protein